MRWMLTLAALAAAPALAADEDAPQRVAIERLPLTGDQMEIGACATRLLSRSAKVLTYPIRDGVGFDWTPKTGLFMSAGGDPILAFEFRRDEVGPFMKLFYRHPFTAKLARGFAQKAGRTCFPDDLSRWEESEKR